MTTPKIDVNKSAIINAYRPRNEGEIGVIQGNYYSPYMFQLWMQCLCCKG